MTENMSSISVPEKGYLYIVCGDRKYFEEALKAVKSLRDHDPEAHVTLVSDVDYGANSFFDKVILDPLNGSDGLSWRKSLLFKTKHIYASTPYLKTLFLDSDTYFIENCRCLFDVLDHYDLCLAHGTNDRTVAAIEGRSYEAITPYNTGVILFKQNEANRNFFTQWHTRYKAYMDIHPHDQPAFTETLAISACKTYVLQNNWNARFIFPEKYAGKVMILHGRHHNLAAIAEKINQSLMPRLWFPLTEQCIYPDMAKSTRLELIRYLFQEPGLGTTCCAGSRASPLLTRSPRRVPEHGPPGERRGGRACRQHPHAQGRSSAVRPAASAGA